jgi:mono/diheme cytochrome c family protein
MNGRWRLRLLFPVLLYFDCRAPSASNGAVVFHNNCLECHSLEPGQNGYGPSLAGFFRRNPSKSVDQTQQLIRNGRRRMPPFRDRLSSDQIQDVIAYINTQ